LLSELAFTAKCLEDVQKNIIILEDHPMNFLTKFCYNWHCGYREEDENIKVYRRQQTPSDSNNSHDFGSGELKRMLPNIIIFSILLFLNNNSKLLLF